VDRSSSNRLVDFSIHAHLLIGEAALGSHTGECNGSRCQQWRRWRYGVAVFDQACSSGEWSDYEASCDTGSVGTCVCPCG